LLVSGCMIPPGCSYGVLSGASAQLAAGHRTPGPTDGQSVAAEPPEDERGELPSAVSAVDFDESGPVALGGEPRGDLALFDVVRVRKDDEQPLNEVLDIGSADPVRQLVELVDLPQVVNRG